MSRSLQHAPLRRGRQEETDARYRTFPAFMLETAYVLIRKDRSTPAEIARQVRRVPGIAEAAVTMGEVDVLAIAHSDSTKGFVEICQQIQKIEGVSSVSVCVVVRP